MTRPAPLAYPRVRWHNSLAFRAIALCAVLVLCLLGSVYTITRHYFHEMGREMEDQTQQIANSIALYTELHPNAGPNDVAKDMMRTYEGTTVELPPYAETAVVIPFTLERDGEGHLYKVARMRMKLQREQVLLTARMAVTPQGEILRAFRNKYLLFLGIVFFVTLGFMVYFILRLLRPLAELSDSCAQIAGGRLRDVAIRKSSGEVLALEHTFNRMVEALREKETIETNLRQAQRLSAIGNLAAGVAHDIRNPLNAIKLLSSHAADQLEGLPETSASVRQIRTIRKEVDRLEEIVSGFLSLAKERELRPEPHRIDDVLRECVRLIEKDAEARGIQVATDLRAGYTTLAIDAKQFTRAVLNVLINAMDAGGRGGRILVFSRLATDTCEIEIRDSGPGIPRETLERVFEPYFTTKGTGTGLGLSITRGIVEEHGGVISIDSVEDQGCQVVIALPLENTLRGGTGNAALPVLHDPTQETDVS